MISNRVPTGPYERLVKRPLDCFLGAVALVGLSPVLACTALAVKFKLGSPIIFRQPRPGRGERVFDLYKFRTMTDERGVDGELLPDEVRLTSFGRWLRSTSIDELPELINILKGDMAVVGPRPQLVRDMTFMTLEQRRRHAVRPGLTGLAQVRGRNAVSWDRKLACDLEYLERITFLGDAAIVLRTVGKVFSREGVEQEGTVSGEDLCDWLLRTGQVSREEYDAGRAEALEIIDKSADQEGAPVPADETAVTVTADGTPRFSVLMSVYRNDREEWLREAIESVANQSLPPDEIVLVVDGPVPEGLDKEISILEQELDGLLRVHRLRENKGLGLALREGMELVSNDIVARMDSDDVSVPERFELQIPYMAARPDLGVLGAQIEEFDDLTREPIGAREVPRDGRGIKAFMRRRCPFNHMTVVLRKSMVENAGGYRDWPQNEDYDLWIRMSESGSSFANLPEMLVKVRVNKALYARRGGIAYFKSELGIQQEMLRMGVISPARFAVNVAERFVLQVAMPNWARSLVYRKLARNDATVGVSGDVRLHR